MTATRYIMGMMQRNSRFLGERIGAMDEFELIGTDEEQLPLVAFKLAERAQLRRVRRRRGSLQLSAAGWCPPTRFPPNAQNVKIMRALVKETLSHALAATLADDIAEACETLEAEGRPASPSAGASKSGTGY